jgi:hypothetical protein
MSTPVSYFSPRTEEQQQQQQQKEAKKRRKQKVIRAKLIACHMQLQIADDTH